MISTPDHWHAIQALAALRKGLHVCCEKAMTCYFDEGRALADVAKKSGLVFRLDSECRSHGYMIKPYLRVEGDEGWIQAHWHSQGGLQAHDRSILTQKLRPDDKTVPTRADKQDFISAITEGTPVMIDAEAGHRVNTQCLLGLAAVKLGKTLEWDPVKEVCTNDAAALASIKGTYREPWRLGGIHD